MLCIAVDQPGTIQFAQNTHDATSTVDILNMVVTVRCHLAQNRYPPRQLVNIGHLEIHASLIGYCQQVKNRIRRATHRYVERHGIAESLLRGDRARQYRRITVTVIAKSIVNDQFGGTVEQLLAFAMCSHYGTVTGQRHSEHLGQTVHRICRKHARTASARRTGRTLDPRKLLVTDSRIGTLDHGVYQVPVAAVGMSSLHRAARHEHRRDIEPHGRHQHSGSYLVTVRYADHRIDTVCIAHVFDTVGNHLARRQRIEHTIVTHSDTVIDGYGIEFGGETAFCLDPRLDLLSDLVKMRMTGHKLRERIDNGYHRFTHLIVLHAVCPPQCTGSGHLSALERKGTTQFNFHK